MKLDSALRTPVFRQLFTCLYQFDVVEEDAVHKWSRAMASQWDSANTDHEAMRKFVAEFVKWLETAETDDDEDESGDEEEEESDDE